MEATGGEVETAVVDLPTDTVVWLAASPEVEGRSGRFWIDRRERQCRFRDEAGEEALWALCRAMTR